MDNQDKKLSLITNIVAKNTAKLKGLQDADQFKDELLKVIETKFSLITNIVAKNGARVKTIRQDLDKEVKNRKDKEAEQDEINERNAKKFGLLTNLVAKYAARMKTMQKEIDDIKKDSVKDKISPEEKTLLTLTSSLSTIAMSLQRINATIGKIVALKPSMAQISPIAPGAVPVAEKEKEKEEGFFGLLKELFTNPAVVAALAGIVYTILPKEVQDEIKGFLTGFSEGLDEAMGKNENEGLGGLNTAIKTAGAVLGVVFGAKIIGGVASAITTTVKLIRMLGVGGKMLGKMGAAGAIVAAGGAAIGAAALMTHGDEEEGTGKGGKKPDTEGGGKEKQPSKPTGGTSSGAEPAGKPSAAATSAASMPGGYLGKAAKYIASKEGLPKGGKAYWDPPGQNNLVSVGYGHQIKPEEYQQGFIQAGDEQIPVKGNRGIDTVMSPAQAEKLLAQDLPKYEQSAAKPLGDAWSKLDDNQKAALISYAYNTGSTGSLVKAGLKDAILSGNLEEAARIIAEKGIATAGGQRNEHLAARRRDEAALFASGKAQPGSTSDVQVASAPTAEPVSTAKNVGKQIGETSQAVKVAQNTPAEPEITTMNSSNATDVGSKQASIHTPIPSPIANRGSLGSSVSHSTAYA